MSSRDRAAAASAHEAPVYLYPEDAARALGRAMRHVDWRARPEEEPPELQDTRPDEAAGLLALALEREQEWLGAEEIAAAARLLRDPDAGLAPGRRPRCRRRGRGRSWGARWL